MTRLSPGVENWIFYSTVLAVFSEAARILWRIDLKLFYVVIGCNFLLLIANWDLKIDRGLLAPVIYIWVSGGMSVVVGSNSFRLWLQQAIGITVCAVYFYMFFRQQRREGEDVFDIYSQVACWVFVLGLCLS